MKSIDLLLQSRPSWVEIEGRRRDGADIVATSPMLGGGPARSFNLELRASRQRGVCILEQKSRQQFPAFCLERHINPDNTFCLYFGSESELDDTGAALSWWSSLGSFLINQVYAEKRAFWPLAAGLSHGDAAREQLAMEALAEPVGWKDDVLRAMFRGKGWMAERLPRVSKTYDRVLNSRSPCPRGCTRKHKLLRKKSCELEACYPDCRKQHRAILRAECPNRNVIDALVLHEHQRRKIEARIIDQLVREGHECCGTMKICPLRERG